MRLKGHICNEDVDIGDLLAGCFYGSESKKLSQILAKALEKVCGVLAITTGWNKLDRDRMKEEQSKIERRMSWEDKEEIKKIRKEEFEQLEKYRKCEMEYKENND